MPFVIAQDENERGLLAGDCLVGRIYEAVRVKDINAVSSVLQKILGEDD